MSEQPDQKRRRNMGVVAVCAAGFIAFRAFSDSKVTLHQTQLMFLVSVMFGLAGLQLITNAKGRLSALMGAVVCAGFSSLGFYVVFWGGPLDGGIPFIPASWNQAFGKILFGFGGCITGAMSLWFLFRAIKLPQKE